MNSIYITHFFNRPREQENFLWWNINILRANIQLNPLSDFEYDIAFMSEIALATETLPRLVGYTGLSNRKIYSHGGIIVYIRNVYINHVIDIIYNECYISFRFNFAPNVVFIGIYIQPENSKNFHIKIFADIDVLFSKCCLKGYIPFIGGDFNARMGDLNTLDKSWKYEYNCDEITNNHGKIYMLDIMKRNEIYPINQLKYKGKIFASEHTYRKSGKKSHIDFVLTDNIGRNYIDKFKVLNENWHLSNHMPICISINIDTEISCHDLLAENLNYEEALEKPVVRRYNKKYNYAKLEQYIAQNKDAIEYDMVTALNENSVNNAVEKLDKYLHEAHRVTKERVKTVINSNTHKMNNVNKIFNVFQESLREGNDEHIAQNLEYSMSSKNS